MGGSSDRTSPVVTVSLGVATAIPIPGSPASDIIGLAAVVGAIVGGGIGAAAGTGAEGTAIAGGAGGILAVIQALGAARQVDSLMDLLLENEGRVLIMIDDVDRCTPHNLVRVIEAVNQIFVAGSDVASKRSFAARKEGQQEEKPRKLVFLMGMDRSRVQGSEGCARSHSGDVVWLLLPRQDHPTLGVVARAQARAITWTIAGGIGRGRSEDRADRGDPCRSCGEWVEWVDGWVHRDGRR